MQPGHERGHVGLVELLNKWFDLLKLFDNMPNISKQAGTPVECTNQVFAGDQGCQLVKHGDPGQNP